MNSPGFKVVTIFSLLITLGTLIGLFTEPIIGLFMMMGLGAYHIITALVLLVLYKRFTKTYRNLLFTYSAAVIAYFIIAVTFLAMGVDPDEESYFFAGFPMLLAVSFVIFKFGLMNSSEDTLNVLRNDESILYM